MYYNEAYKPNVFVEINRFTIYKRPHNSIYLKKKQHEMYSETEEH